jgi:hypothetical protein
MLLGDGGEHPVVERGERVARHGGERGTGAYNGHGPPVTGLRGGGRPAVTDGCDDRCPHFPLSSGRQPGTGGFQLRAR